MKGETRNAKSARLAAALRENLRRRKAQARQSTAHLQPGYPFDQALAELRGTQPDRGVAMIEGAAADGNGDAMTHVALLEALGVLRPPSWPRALDRLRDAALLGSTKAARQLILLAERRFVEDLSEDADRDWAGLRDAIPLEALLTPPPSTTIRPRPLLRQIAQFASAAECAWLIDAARDRLERASVRMTATGEIAEEAMRTNSSAMFKGMDSDCIIEMIRLRLAGAIGVPVACFEAPQVLHYAPGQEFKLHVDYFDPGSPGFRDEIARNGQRIATVLLYLNSDYEGGATQFPAIGVEYRGRTGDLLLFSNVDPTGGPDRATLHAGLPPTKGEKWVLSQWVREHPPLPASP